MPKYIIRWSEKTILTAIVDADNAEAAGDIVRGGTTPVMTTAVARSFDQMLSVRPSIDLKPITKKSESNSEGESQSVGDL